MKDKTPIPSYKKDRVTNEWDLMDKRILEEME